MPIICHTMTMSYNRGRKRRSYSIVELVSWQKWHNLHDILSREGDDRERELPPFDDRTKNRLPEEHILHLACQHQAPPQIIELLARRYPRSASTPERKGRYPVHIACARGLKPKVVDFLVRSHPQGAGRQDDYGKTPLHYACESYAAHYRRMPANAHSSEDESLRTVVGLLLKEFPALPNVEDLGRMNAIEYAIDNAVDLKTIKTMQNSSRDHWRKMRKLHRGKSHEELRKDVAELSSSLRSCSLSNEEFGYGNEQEGKENDRERNAPKQIDLPEPERKVHAARTA
ncbi:hypothetical protein ACHAWF_008759 [Thalassiosira exigua]